MKLGKASGHSKALCRSALCALTLIATILAVLSSASAFAASAREKVIYSFQGGNDGANPWPTLIADRNGNLYGTTVSGGLSLGCLSGCGTVFELSPPATEGGAWIETQLYVFQGGDTDGANPVGALVFDKAGNLYGTTADGGPGDSGTVFELSPPATPGESWTETILYIFPADGSRGLHPGGNLIVDSAGNLYGTNQSGGLTTCDSSPPLCGTAFELSPPATSGGSWTETVLHEFGGIPSDGFYPQSGLVFDRKGNLYGTTFFGGGTGQFGTVYQLARAGGVWHESVIYRFAVAGIILPYGKLTLDESGKLYGMADTGVFELTPHSNGIWSEQTLYSFTGGKDGAGGKGSLARDKAGNLYGTAGEGGLRDKGTLNGNGTVFELSPPVVSGGAWTHSTLHRFAPAGFGDGAYPTGGVVMVYGKLYGTTYYGGSEGYGTVFRVVVVP